MRKKILITDLDDTLYSWIGFFIPAFYDMVNELSSILKTPEEQLIKEYKALHQECGNVEQPYTTLELPSVLKSFPNKNKKYISEQLNEAFHKFNSTRKKKLKLYEGVYDTLELLNKNGITIIGYTESAEENGFYRLKKLGVSNFFRRVYVADSKYSKTDNSKESEYTRKVLLKKPSPQVLLDICKYENFLPEEAIYVGDSLTKDIYMALGAKIMAVWINYQENNKELYKKLIGISHWTDNDFQNEKSLKDEWVNQRLHPDIEIHNFRELPALFKIE